MNDAEKRFFNAWELEHFSIIIEAFKTVIEETGQMPIEAFDYIVGHFAQEAFNDFAKELGIKDPQDIPRQFSGNLFGVIIGGFNSALPRDHQYVVIGIFSDKSPAVRIGVTNRKNIPGYHDIINTRIAPIFNLTNIELLKGGCIIKNIKIKDIDFGGNADLDKML